MKFSCNVDGKVFYFPKQEDTPEVSKAWVKLRTLSAGKVIQTISENTEHHVEFRPSGENEVQRQVEFDVPDNDKMFDEMCDYVIVDWGNVEIDNAVVPCNTANKIRLMRDDPFFSECITGWRTQMEKELVDSIEVKRKN